MITGGATAQAWRDSLSVARKLYQENHFVEALEKYEQTRRIAPKNIDLSSEIGQAAFRAKKFDQASQTFEKRARKSKSADAYHNLGNSYMEAEHYAKAIEAYKNALRINPADEETRYNLALAMQKNNQQQQPKPKNEGSNDPNQTPKNEPNKDKSQPKDDDEDNESNTQKPSKLADKKTDRILDDLMRQEIETKKKIERQQQRAGSNPAQKDW